MSCIKATIKMGIECLNISHALVEFNMALLMLNPLF